MMREMFLRLDIPGLTWEQFYDSLLSDPMNRAHLTDGPLPRPERNQRPLEHALRNQGPGLNCEVLPTRLPADLPRERVEKMMPDEAHTRIMQDMAQDRMPHPALLMAVSGE